jgi:hypothetical protein
MNEQIGSSSLTMHPLIFKRKDSFRRGYCATPSEGSFLSPPIPNKENQGEQRVEHAENKKIELIIRQPKQPRQVDEKIRAVGIKISQKAKKKLDHVRAIER